MNGTKRKTHETICIECKYQCSRRCSWAWEFIPVHGWNAIETKNGFDVYECPNFEEGRGLPRSGLDTDGVIACLQALMAQTRDDYIKGRDLHINDKGKPTKCKYQKIKRWEEQINDAARTRAGNRRSIENWIRGDGSKMMMLSDPEAVIRQLRKFANKYEQEKAIMNSKLDRRLRP